MPQHFSFSNSKNSTPSVKGPLLSELLLTEAPILDILVTVNKPSVTAIIPARYGSTRLPGKALLEIAGRPMIAHVYQRACEAGTVNRVIVATDDPRIADAIQAIGGEAVLTSPEHRSGTERIAEVAARLDSEIIVNVQGDEPLIAPSTIDAVVKVLLEDSQVQMATTSEPLQSIEDILNPSVVKVITDRSGFALYFSRQPIPYPREEARRAGSLTSALQACPSLVNLYRKHTGLYAYRRWLLLRLASLPPSLLEEAEHLEQLRALENGIRIKVVPVNARSIGVDTLEDLVRVREILTEQLNCSDGARSTP